MNFNRNFIIMQPIQLPWQYVSPANYRGLDYHLSPDLTIRLENLMSSTVKVDGEGRPKQTPDEMELLVGQEIFITYDEEHFKLGTESTAERTFEHEIMPMKSKERINRAFKDKSGSISCFFTDGQMDHFTRLFETSYFICHKVSVFYKGRFVEDIAELPSAEFKLAIQAFSDLNIQATMDYKDSMEEMNEAYAAYFEKKVAKLDAKLKQNKWENLKSKDAKKKMLIAAGAMAVGTLGRVAKFRWARSGSWGMGFVGVAIGLVSLALELYGRNIAMNITKYLN